MSTPNSHMFSLEEAAVAYALAAEHMFGGDAMTISNDRSRHFVREMICGAAFDKTRESYASRRLGYGEVYEGDLEIIPPIPEWIDTVKQTALNLDRTRDKGMGPIDPASGPCVIHTKTR